MKLNIEILRSFEPCYDPTEYLSEDWEGTLIEVLKDNRIPTKDRIWVFSKSAPEDKCREFARWCALQVIDKWDAPDIVREYLKTGNEKLRLDARAAANAAANAAAYDAAWYDAYAAARAAAYAANAAADAATYAAAYAANAADAAARNAQLQKAIELLNQ